MPFSVKLNFGSEHQVVFEGWIENAFGKYVPKGTAFAKARGPNGPGFIVTTYPVFLSSAEPFELGRIVARDTDIAYGNAEGEDIAYGKAHCVFVQEIGGQNLPEGGQGFRLRVL